MSTSILLHSIDRISYHEALALQLGYHKQAADSEISGALVLLEHDPVITMGVKSTSRGNVLVPKEALMKAGVDLVETDRGGDVTYHGPGQLVGYPILRIRDLGLDVHSYLRTLEQTIIDALATFGLNAGRNGPAGVWVGEQKVCSIGVAVKKWVTYHGFALNVDPNMAHFSLINPCGLQPSQLSSLKGILGVAPPMSEVREACARSFEANFGVTLVNASP